LPRDGRKVYSNVADVKSMTGFGCADSTEKNRVVEERRRKVGGTFRFVLAGRYGRSGRAEASEFEASYLESIKKLDSAAKSMAASKSRGWVI